MQEVFERIVEKLKEISIFMTTCDGYGANCVSVGTIEEIVKQEAEKYDNGWIPCSERLPEKYNRVLAYTDAGGYYIAHVNGCGKFVCTAECVSTVIENSDVIAWQTLPAPYQPKGDQHAKL